MLPIFMRLGARCAVGTDASMEAARLVPRRGGSFVVSDAGRLPFEDGSVTCLTSMDVIEHLDDDVSALREYARVTAPGGIVLLMVPAWPWLWSPHDVLVGHRRRYTMKTLKAAVEAAGLTPARSTFFHSWLLPVAAVARKTPLRRLVRGSGEESSYVHPLVNRIFLALCRLERRILRRGRLPFGVSILLVARRA
jgi:SAM-dependent methyltransferase